MGDNQFSLGPWSPKIGRNERKILPTTSYVVYTRELVEPCLVHFLTLFPSTSSNILKQDGEITVSIHFFLFHAT